MFEKGFKMTMAITKQIF